MKKTSLPAVVFFLAIFLTTSTMALAAGQMSEEPSATAIVADVVIIRPLGLVSVVIGSALFVVALPFTIPAQGVKMTARKLVVEPFHFTFTRSIGETREAGI